VARNERQVTDQARILDSIRESRQPKVKVAVADLDGVLRGKYIHKRKFFSVVENGFGFCDEVFGCDLHEEPYDNAYMAGAYTGARDAVVRLDLDTYRTVPWDDDVPMFLGSFFNADGTPYPICPRQVLIRVLKRAREMGFEAKAGVEYEFFNFAETPRTWAAKKGQAPEPITPGMYAYSVLRMGSNRDYFNAIVDEMERFGVPLEALHTETGPGVYEAAILYGDALEAADRAILFKTGVKEIAARFGIMPCFMAKWSSKYPGCSGHVHQSLSDGERNVFHDPGGRHRGMSKLFESYVAGQQAFLLEFGPMFWPTVNSYKRLVDGFWAPTRPTWGIDNRTVAFRVLPGSPNAARIETRCPGADSNPYLAIAACIAAGLEGVAQKLDLTHAPVTGDNVGAEDVVRAPRSLVETTRIFHASKIARDWFGTDFVNHFAATREWEWRKWLDAVTDWELRRYFEIV